MFAVFLAVRQGYCRSPMPLLSSDWSPFYSEPYLDCSRSSPPDGLRREIRKGISGGLHQVLASFQVHKASVSHEHLQFKLTISIFYIILTCLIQPLMFWRFWITLMTGKLLFFYFILKAKQWASARKGYTHSAISFCKKHAPSFAMHCSSISNTMQQCP